VWDFKDSAMSRENIWLDGGAIAAQLTAPSHVVSSVGWLGAVAVFLTLGVVGLTSRVAEVVRAVCLAMEPAGWSLLVPWRSRRC